MNYDITDRFELLVIETAQEYIERKRLEKIQLDKELMIVINKAMKERKKVEEKGVCEGCEEKKEYLRWVRNNEFYCCYDCFIHDLDCEASVMVPMYRVDQMRDYVSEGVWEELYEEGLEEGWIVPPY